MMRAHGKLSRLGVNRHIKITPNGIKRTTLVAPQVLQEMPAVKPLRTRINPTHFFLSVTHTNKGVLDDHARQTIATAAILAGENTAVLALILGECHEDLGAFGADIVIIKPEFDFHVFQPDSALHCVLETIEKVNPSRIFMPDNMRGDGELGRRLIAAQPLKSAATDVVEIDEHHIARPQKGRSRLVISDLPHIILLSENVSEITLPFRTLATTELETTELETTLACDALKKSHEKSNKPLGNNAQTRYQHLDLLASASERMALEEADCIVSAGNGVNNVSTLETLARALNAAVGASRVAVDNGKFLYEQQIGASGKTVSASLYFAIGISGAVQHLQGIKDCRHVIAINLDASAPIVKRADLTVIGDAEDIMQSLILAITQIKDKKLIKND